MSSWFPTPYYEDELIDLGEIDREQLKGLGLRVESADTEGMARAAAYQKAKPQFTFHDCLAVTLAAINDWPQLTGDKRVRALADDERLEVHGVLCISDRFAEHRIVRRATLAKALRGMLNDPRTRLPHPEIHKRLALLSAKQG